MNRGYCCRQAGLLLQRRTYSSQASSSTAPLPKREWSTARGSVNPVKSKLQKIKLPPSSPSSSVLSPRRAPSSKLSPRPSKTLNADEVEIEDHEGSWRPSLANKNLVTVRPEYLAHRRALKKEFPNGWSPPRKLSREAMDGLRTLHSHDPEMFTTPFLASRFKISPEAVRRILRSKWQPDEKRRSEIAKKEVQLREAWIDKKRREKAERRRRPVEMFMDVESDKLFEAGVHRDADDEPSVEAAVPRRV